ncbi:MAG: hypothetical protein A3F72_18385 [Bacteroidetes bacterium RIFCSPLOWO2_12_FULL_35_15]|nr:MAG: hypothetical protein A3F72_18385 [Bacteroidetes bacterium RIFCSPLOWO2_12_FULL_35_15]
MFRFIILFNSLVFNHAFFLVNYFLIPYDDVKVYVFRKSKNDCNQHKTCLLRGYNMIYFELKFAKKQ